MSVLHRSAWLAQIAAILMLTGCAGGGGDEGDETGDSGGDFPSVVNQSPVARAGADQSVASGATVTLSGTTSSDPDGTIASYSWTQMSGTSVTLSGASSSSATFKAPTVATAAALTFRLTVTDNNGATHTDTVQITVNPSISQTLAAHAGSSRNVASGTTVTLDATASTGMIASYVWQQTSGPTVGLSGAASSMATFVAPTVTSSTVLTFRLTVTGTQGGTSTADVSITVDSDDDSTASCTPTSSSPVSQSQAFMSLHEFAHDPLVSLSRPYGSQPEDGLVEGPDGNFYGVSRYGGVDKDGYNGRGVIFKLTPQGQISRVHTFQYLGPSMLHGIHPVGGLIVGNDCNFYGTTYQGYNGGGAGTVFKMTPSGTVTYLAGFDGTSGQSPLGKLLQASDGNFYGITMYGGAYRDQVTFNYTGTVFKVTPSGTLTTLVSFNQTNGGEGRGTLIEGNDGFLYGVTSLGGANNYGTIFKVSKSGQFTSLHSFSLATGHTPWAGLRQGPDGYFYGTTLYSGPKGGGTIYKISSSGEFSIVHAFDPVTVELGCNCGLFRPYPELVLADDGHFYGVTAGGTSSSAAREQGAVFRLTTQGVLTPIAYFPRFGPADVLGELIQGRDGYLYGASSRGGAADGGVFFRVKIK